jgi:hypothetical protein
VGAAKECRLSRIYAGIDVHLILAGLKLDPRGWVQSVGANTLADGKSAWEGLCVRFVQRRRVMGAGVIGTALGRHFAP